MRLVGLCTGVVAAGLFACGGGGGGGQSCTPGPSFTLTISASGVSPTNACVSPGPPAGTVTFQNNDSVPHTVTLTGGGCPAPLTVTAGGSNAFSFPTEVQCAYQVSPGAGSAFAGTIISTTVVQSGGGY